MIDGRLRLAQMLGAGGQLRESAAQYQTIVQMNPAVVDAWAPGDKVVVYCSSLSCQASHEVGRRLREQVGMENVFVPIEAVCPFVLQSKSIVGSTRVSIRLVKLTGFV